jgi:hypothetical protein
MVHRIMQAESDDRHLSIFGSFVGGDSNHAAVTLQILEGTSRGEVLFRLDGLRNAVLNHWEKIAGGKMILHDKATGETVTRDSFECGNKNGVQLVETLAQAKDESQNATVSAA